MTPTTSVQLVEAKQLPPIPIIESAYVVIELSRRTKLLNAFRSEESAKRYLTQVKEENTAFANPPAVL